MQSRKLTEQLRKVDWLCIVAGDRLGDDNATLAPLWSAIYTLSVAMFYILTQLIKENEKHE